MKISYISRFTHLDEEAFKKIKESMINYLNENQ